MNLTGGQLAGGNSTTQKAENDYYATDPKTVRAFLDTSFNIFKEVKTILEPCCGEGHLSGVLEEYFECEINNIDLVDRGFGYGGIDYLNTDFKGKSDLIMTNPPFSLVNDFIVKGIEDTNRFLVLLCKIQLLETVKRKEIFDNTPLKYVYVHSKRQATWKNGEPLDPKGNKWATTMCLAWFVWDKKYEGEPIIRFI